MPLILIICVLLGAVVASFIVGTVNDTYNRNRTIHLIELCTLLCVVALTGLFGYAAYSNVKHPVTLADHLVAR